MAGLDRYAKAVVGALVAALSTYQVAVLSHGVSADEWAGIAIAFIVALGLVWAVPNAPAEDSDAGALVGDEVVDPPVLEARKV